MRHHPGGVITMNYKNTIYTPNNNIDHIVSVTIDGHNTQIIKRVNIPIPRPYLKHDCHKCKTYEFSRSKITPKELSDICSDEDFNDAIAIEFYKENNTDASPEERAEEFYERARNRTWGLPIEVIKKNYKNSHVDELNTNAESTYIIFRGDKKKKTTLQKLVMQ